jgi:hypothetical protein
MLQTSFNAACLFGVKINAEGVAGILAALLIFFAILMASRF